MTLHNKHQDIDNELQKVKGFWVYVYFTVTSLSGVGFGDITMQTFVGRILVAILIVIFLSYLASNFTNSVSVIVNSINYLRYAPKAITKSTRVVIYHHNMSAHSLYKLLKEFCRRKYNLSHHEIIILQPD